jgi:hypothetical protein
MTQPAESFSVPLAAYGRAARASRHLYFAWMPTFYLGLTHPVRREAYAEPSRLCRPHRSAHGHARKRATWLLKWFSLGKGEGAAILASGQHESDAASFRLSLARIGNYA